MDFVLALVALVAIGICTREVNSAWGPSAAAAVATASLAVTLLIPYGAVAVLAVAVWLYQRAGEDRMNRLARGDRLDTTTDLPPTAQPFGGWLWAAVSVAVAASLTSLVLFGFPLKLDGESNLADFDGEGMEHLIPQQVVQGPDSFEHLDDISPDSLETTADDQQLVVGERARLGIGDEGGGIPVAKKRTTYSAMAEGLTEDDPDLLDELLADEEMFFTRGNTEAELLDIDDTAVKVELLEGPFHNTTGWVSADWVHPIE